MNYKILIIDDDRSIHEDFLKVLNPLQNSQENVINDLSERIFSNSTQRSVFPHYEIHSVFGGKQAIEIVKKSVLENSPFALMFVDVKMGDDMDGIATIQALRKIDSNIETVICSAYAAYTLEEIVSKIPRPDKLLFFKKPFTPVEIKQLAHCLCLKWSSQKKIPVILKT